MKRAEERRRARLNAAFIFTLTATSAAAGVETSLPQALWLGAPSGPTSAREVDASGTRHAAALPVPDRARVAWQRRLAAGVSGNLLVDADGRIFAPGLRRVTELAPDGSPRHELEAPFTACVAAALLADGTRAVLTREGRVIGWTEAGARALQAELPVPPPTASSALVPLPDGGLLVASGRWLFVFDASRGSPLYASTPVAIAHVRLVQERVLLIDERGRVLEWVRNGAPRVLGELSGPAAAVLGDGERLVALTGSRALETLDLASGRVRQHARFDAPGPLPLLALAEPGSWVLLGPDGDWLVLGASPAPPARLRPSRDAGGRRDAQLLVDAGGVVAQWGSNRPLVLSSAAGERTLPGVRCSDPVSLVPAGEGRLLAACGSGAIWAIDSGPAP
ncbi:MAG TPA: hypothetical protein VNN80_09355 [Polyangiaceae bacterium]|nr:hypothetical protein [Polyangiaceae bacterium]